jgi:AcrR family transcriptional regulator
VAAALDLYERGATPTVAQAATEAGISRATAYRYFPTRESLIVELAVTPAVAEIESILDNLPSADGEERLGMLLTAFNRIAIAEEPLFRTALRVAQDIWLRSHRRGDPDVPAVREGRRMRWLEVVLAPLGDLPTESRRRVQAALALTLGMDAIVVMKDVCGLDNDETLAVLRWASAVLLRAGLQELPLHEDQPGTEE